MIVTIEYDDGHKAVYDAKAVHKFRSAWEEVCASCQEDLDNYRKECEKNGQKVDYKNNH